MKLRVQALKPCEGMGSVAMRRGMTKRLHWERMQARSKNGAGGNTPRK